MTDYPEPDEPREAALRAAVLDFSTAVVGGGATEEEVVTAMEAVRQIPIDLERMTNALHVPSDAGDYEDNLLGLLQRIPDGWGRWIQCGPGWYPILARLNERLEEFDPDYQILQIKEKPETHCDRGFRVLTTVERLALVFNESRPERVLRRSA
jgi:hypothetical protein